MFVSRRAIHSDNEPVWVYWCSCDDSRAVLIDSLSHHVHGDWGDLQTTECYHIQAAKFIICEMDAVHDISPSLEFAGYYKIVQYAKCYNCAAYFFFVRSYLQWN